MVFYVNSVEMFGERQIIGLMEMSISEASAKSQLYEKITDLSKELYGEIVKARAMQRIEKKTGPYTNDQDTLSDYLEEFMKQKSGTIQRDYLSDPKNYTDSDGKNKNKQEIMTDKEKRHELLMGINISTVRLHAFEEVYWMMIAPEKLYYVPGEEKYEIGNVLEMVPENAVMLTDEEIDALEDMEE